jgi:hypothetical protein
MTPTMALTLHGLVRALRPSGHTPILDMHQDDEDAFVPRAEMSSEALRLFALRRQKENDDDVVGR